MKKSFFPLLILLLLLNSCADRYVSQKETYYLVTAENSNLYESQSTKSRVVVRLELNEKLKGEIEGDWLFVSDSAKQGYVRMINLTAKEEYVKVNVFEGNELQTFIDDILYNKLKISEWTFWASLLFFPLMAIVFYIFISNKLEAKFVKEEKGDLDTAVNVTPIYIAIIVSFQSVLFYFYYVESILYITNPSWLPLEGDMVQWLWTISFYLIGLTLLSDLFSGIKNYGISNGLVRFVLGLITVVFTAAASFILSWTFIAIAIIILIFGVIALIASGFGGSQQPKSDKRDIYKETSEKWAKQRAEEERKNAEREFFERSQKQYRND